MATLKDIAEYTGVSAMTVSNVIHGKFGRVSPETVERVQKAIRELDYVPNLSARTLKSSSSKVIAWVSFEKRDVDPSADTDLPQDPFGSVITYTVESYLRKSGYFLMVRRISSPEELISFLVNWNIDGLFATGLFQDEFFEALQGKKIPMVCIDSYVTAPNVYNVGLDDMAGSYLATQHLIEKGHRRIAFTSPSIREGGVIRARFNGYRHALEANGIPLDPSLIMEYEFDLMSCRQCAARIAQIPGITGIVSTADIMAVGIMTGLRELGFRIPDDYSIVGFDDMAIDEMVSPPLTTIHQDIVKKGISAAEIMLSLLNGNAPEDREVILPCHLVSRSSVREI